MLYLLLIFCPCHSENFFQFRFYTPTRGCEHPAILSIHFLPTQLAQSRANFDGFHSIEGLIASALRFISGDSFDYISVLKSVV